MRRVRNRLTYANVVATLALVIAVAGGTAYAANTVFSTDIVNDQVYSADVRNDTLAGGGLGAQDLRSGAVAVNFSSGYCSRTPAHGAIPPPPTRSRSRSFQCPAPWRTTGRRSPEVAM